VQRCEWNASLVNLVVTVDFNTGARESLEPARFPKPGSQTPDGFWSFPWVSGVGSATAD
jgi:hypothetical protein